MKRCLIFVSLTFQAVALYSAAQQSLKPSLEVRLPIPSVANSFDRETNTKDFTALVSGENHTLLALIPNATKEWHLVRIHTWWKQPSFEVLPIQGLYPEGRGCCSLHVALQVTPNGQDAVVIASEEWLLPLFHRTEKVHSPETIVTVVDLSQWKVVHSIRTREVEEARFSGARVVNNRWLAFRGYVPESKEYPYKHLYERRYRLLDLPTLEGGPSCTARILLEHVPVPSTPREVWLASLADRDKNNDAACADVLKASGTDSVKSLASLIFKNHRQEPDSVRLHNLYGRRLGEEQANERFPYQAEESEEDDFYDQWDDPSRYRYETSLPYQSKAGNWYDLSGDMKIYSYDGKLVHQVSVAGALCDVGVHSIFSVVCGCHIDDVDEDKDTLIANCRAQRGDFLGTVIKEWRSVIRIDSLSENGYIPLPKGAAREPARILTTPDGKTFVVAIFEGNLLRVYPVETR